MFLFLFFSFPFLHPDEQMLEGRGGGDEFGEESGHRLVNGLVIPEEVDPVNVCPAMSAMTEVC